MERHVCPDRAWLCGLGEEILILVVQHASPAQLTDWLKLPLELSAGDADFLLKPNECCQVRRKGEQLLTVVMERASSEQWLKWLQLPMEHALPAGKSFLVEQLLAAGAKVINTAGSAERGAGKSSACLSDNPPPVPAAFSCCKPSPEESAVVRVATSSSCCAGPPAPPASPAPSSSCCRGTAFYSAERKERRVSSASLPVVACPASANDAVNGGVDFGIIDVAGAAAFVASDNLCLHRATMARDLGRMRECLAGGVDRNATDLWSCTALHRAAEKDDAEPVRLLLSAGLDVRARDMEGYSPLHFAAARGAETAVVDLLAAGSCLSDRGLNGDTPLHSAVRFLSLATVSILLESGADEGAKNEEGHTPKDVTGVLPDGRDIEDQPDPLKEQGILALLAAAPAVRRLRTWKRRSWLVMVRARAQKHISETAVGVVALGAEDIDLGAEERTEDDDLEMTLRCNPGKCCRGGSASGGGVEGRGDALNSELLGLVRQTIGLAEEGVFQKIVLFL